MESTSGRFTTSPRVVPGTVNRSVRGLSFIEATSVGLGRLVGNEWAVFVRVAEREFEGRNAYRHLEDEDEIDV